MGSENSDLKTSEFYYQDANGNVQKLGEIQQFGSVTDERDDAADAMRFYTEAVSKGVIANGSLTIRMNKEESRRFLKTLGLETITRKRFKKLLMGAGIQRNMAEKMVETVRKHNMKYTPNTIQTIIEIIIEEVEKEQK